MTGGVFSPRSLLCCLHCSRQMKFALLCPVHCGGSCDTDYSAFMRSQLISTSKMSFFSLKSPECLFFSLIPCFSSAFSAFQWTGGHFQLINSYLLCCCRENISKCCCLLAPLFWRFLCKRRGQLFFFVFVTGRPDGWTKSQYCGYNYNPAPASFFVKITFKAIPIR